LNVFLDLMFLDLTLVLIKPPLIVDISKIE
jgi:hypothetical protein